MRISGATVLVTGANRGIGAAFVQILQEMGAAKIYAAARNPDQVEAGPLVVPIKLDVTNADHIQAATKSCSDLTLLINNAGVTCIQNLLEPPTTDHFREVMEINCFGPLMLSRAFAPTLAANGGGGIINILSMAAMLCVPGAPAYSASKAAAEMMSHGLRLELAEQGTQVSIVYPGYVDTRMSETFPVKKADPSLIAGRCLESFEKGDTIIYPDLFSRMTHEKLVNETDAVQTDPQAAVMQLVEAFISHPDAGT